MHVSYVYIYIYVCFDVHDSGSDGWNSGFNVHVILIFFWLELVTSPTTGRNRVNQELQLHGGQVRDNPPRLSLDMNFDTQVAPV